MGHFGIEKKSAFAFEPLFLTDEEGRPLFVPVVKATYRIMERRPLVLSEKQLPINTAGEYWGKPDNSFYKYESETAFIKPATDVVLIGHAYAPRPGTTEVSVGVRVGPVHKVVRVVGDRTWVRTAGLLAMTPPRPFERIPLIYERAF